jgi:peptidoglycan/xylan/chitin deacetylase (PgdA/CDA1 family)
MWLLERGESQRTNRLRILTYHRVDDARAFARQMDHIARRYRVISADELLEAVDSGDPLPPRALMITFDDAYRDFADRAWPALRARRLPAVLFVPTAFPDQVGRAFWWDRLSWAMWSAAGRARTVLGPLDLGTPRARHRAFRRLREELKCLPHAKTEALVEQLCRDVSAAPARNEVIGWDELRQLHREGVAIAPHTRTHPLLDRVGRDQMREEITGSLADLRREIGVAPPLFAYPGGSYSPDVVECVRAAGVRVAVTTVRGTNDLGRDDPLRLRRINIGGQADESVLRARLLESRALLNRWRPVPETVTSGRVAS